MSLKKSFSAVSAALTVIGFSSAALANVITIGGAATVTCTPSCQAIVGGSINDVNGPGFGNPPGTPGSLSSSLGGLYSFKPANPTEEVGALNILAGTNFTTGTQIDSGGVSNFSFSTTAQWIVMKLGVAGSFFLFNPVGTLSVTYAKNGLMGGGLSHYLEVGQAPPPPPIPIPGAVWLMGAGLAGLGFAGRRKR